MTCSVLTQAGKVKAVTLTVASYVILGVLMQCVRVVTTWGHLLAFTVSTPLQYSYPSKP